MSASPESSMKRPSLGQFVAVSVDNLGTAMLASFGMTAVGAVTGSVLAIDDDVVWRRNVVRKMVHRLEPPEPTDVPSVLFIQIDGLSEPVLRRAIP